MRIISKLNNTTRIIIMVTFTLVMFTLSFIFIGESKVNANYKDFGDSPFNEHIYVAMRAHERREISQNPTIREKANWYLTTQVLEIGIPLDSPADGNVKNVNLYILIETVDGNFIYKETTPKDDLGKIDFNPTANFGSESSGLTQQEEYNSSEKTYTKIDKSPKRVYIQVVYDLRIKNENNEYVYERGYTLKYKYEVARADDQDFDEYVKTELLNNGFINFKENAFFGALIQKRDVSGSGDTINFRTTLFYNPTETVIINEMRDTPISSPQNGDRYINNENGYVYTYNTEGDKWSAAAAKENTAYTEKTSGTVYLWNTSTSKFEKPSKNSQMLNPETVQKVDVAIYLKAANEEKDENNFIADYIQLVNLSGMIPQTPRNTTTSLPSRYLTSPYRIVVPYSSDYAISEVYVKVVITLTNGQKLENKVKFPVNLLTTY